MKLINTDKELLKKYINMDKTILYLSLVPYKNNTCIKAYTEDGEPIGDVEENCISEYLNKQTVVMFLKQNLNDDTGLYEYILSSDL